jgi:hypothetical protein
MPVFRLCDPDAAPHAPALPLLSTRTCNSYAQLLKTFEAAAARRPPPASPRPASSLAPASASLSSLPMSPLRLASGGNLLSHGPSAFSLDAYAPPPSAAASGAGAPSGPLRPGWAYVGYVGRGETPGHSSPQLLRRDPWSTPVGAGGAAQPPAVAAAIAASGAGAVGSPRGSPRISRPEIPDSPESVGREPPHGGGSPPRLSLEAGAAAHRAAASGAASVGLVAPGGRMPLPPVRTAALPPQQAKPLSPAAATLRGGGGGGVVPSTPLTPQTKRALFGAVAEAAAAAAAAAAGGVRSPRQALTASITSSPRAVLRPEAPSPRPFTLEAVGSPRHVRLGPVPIGSGTGAERAGSPSTLRLDPFRHSGADAFSLGAPAHGGALPPPHAGLPSSASAPALVPLQPQPRSPLRGMGRRPGAVTPLGLSSLGPHHTSSSSLHAAQQAHAQAQAQQQQQQQQQQQPSSGRFRDFAALDDAADPQDYRMASPLPHPPLPPSR